MPRDTQVNNLIINKLSKEQYEHLKETGAVSDTELYVVPDEGEIVSLEWGNITGTLSNQVDLKDALDAKQDSLIAGTGIIIENNTISSTGSELEIIPLYSD